MKNFHRPQSTIYFTAALLLITSISFAGFYQPKLLELEVNNAISDRRVNVPNLSSVPFEPAVFWFGGVTPTTNSTDVRIWHYDQVLKITLHIIDRRLWHDTDPSAPTLDDWDAATLLLDLDGNTGNAPDAHSYRFVIQFGASESDLRYQATYQGNGSTWISSSVPFTAESTYRGEGGPNSNSDNKGWQLSLSIPFSSLGLSDPPTTQTVWGLGVAVHDRDDAAGTPISDQVWPEQMDSSIPSTWGQLHFGRTQYQLPLALPQGETTIRAGIDGAIVPDAHVGGNFTCADGLDHWSEWGEANYAGSTQINIQNQWDISDYPCFSKYFASFPVESVPSGKVIISAQLKMTMFGNSGGGQWGEPPDSYIQVLTIGDAWNESTLTWNNAPLALENISGTWVKPVQTSDQREYYWDVSKAVMEAYQSGEPVRLALYSADGPMHTGKYFWSSDVGEWNASQRPTLQVVWGEACDSGIVDCTFGFLPFVSR